MQVDKVQKVKKYNSTKIQKMQRSKKRKKHKNTKVKNKIKTPAISIKSTINKISDKIFTIRFYQKSLEIPLILWMFWVVFNKP